MQTPVEPTPPPQTETPVKLEQPQPTPATKAAIVENETKSKTPFDKRRDLQYLEKLTCRVLAALQTSGAADLDTISKCVKADPKAVAEVLDVLYATPLVTLVRPPVVVGVMDGPAPTVQYQYAHNKYDLDTINPSSFQDDYTRVLHQVNESTHNVQALEAAIAKREQEMLLETSLEQPVAETGDDEML